jgi:predicted patatin/cPLA2 family phospholipase
MPHESGDARRTCAIRGFARGGADRLRPVRIVMMALLAAGTASGCGRVLVRNPVPTALVAEVQPLGRSDVRLWGDTLAQADLDAFVARRGAAVRTRYGEELARGDPIHLQYLAISGGGQWGAFTAGVLRGWSERGDRPEFIGVSGISTGAIIAPFAFLGPAYDDVLEEAYTTVRTADLVRSTLFSGIVSGAGLTDTAPLAGHIARYVTQDLLDAIAVEHRKGRELVIGTTNLDAGRPVLWDIGQIANSGHPDALQLVRDLILASASIPVAFPPVFVEVTAPDGRTYDEMHVDGGAASQVTFVSPQVPIAAATRAALGRDLDRELFVLVNNDLTPPYRQVRPRVPAIGAAAVSSLIRGSGTGDLYRLFAIAERDDIAFHVAWIPPDVPCDAPTEDFDPLFMRCLYDFGADQLRSGAFWQDAPPNFVRGLAVRDDMGRTVE